MHRHKLALSSGPMSPPVASSKERPVYLINLNSQKLLSDEKRVACQTQLKESNLDPVTEKTQHFRRVQKPPRSDLLKTGPRVTAAGRRRLRENHQIAAGRIEQGSRSKARPMTSPVNSLTQI